MKNKVIEFKQFLKSNNIKKKELPKPIQEMIEIYDQLYELVDTIEEPNLQELMEQLEKLDIEILEDIEEEYEDQLTNNKRVKLPKKSEVIVKKSPPKTIPKKKKTDEMILDEKKLDIEILKDIEEEYEDRLTNNKRTELIKKPEVIVKKSSPKTPQKRVPPKEKTDEMILDELVKMKRTKGIKRSKLRDMGLKTKIGGDTIIGKYMLERTSFFYHVYDIILMK
ncbi:hypothetical protein [Aquimarina latercula]|uniref:hypothetical protein n=1 Tax=Aquimarina latercula TaxID=987 RepID=UPI00040D9164|nr:hypothetical protein [Aquimarina latercula]